MKYPKEWHKELKAWIANAIDYGTKGSIDRYVEDVLTALSDAGALKDPPKPREFWVVMADDFTPIDVCENKDFAFKRCQDLRCVLRPIHVREVIEE